MLGKKKKRRGTRLGKTGEVFEKGEGKPWTWRQFWIFFAFFWLTKLPLALWRQQGGTPALLFVGASAPTDSRAGVPPCWRQSASVSFLLPSSSFLLHSSFLLLSSSFLLPTSSLHLPSVFLLLPYLVLLSSLFLFSCLFLFLLPLNILLPTSIDELSHRYLCMFSWRAQPIRNEPTDFLREDMLE